MKVDLDVLSSIRRRIRVELPADAVNQEFLRTYESLGKRVRIPGFRPGKAPRSVLQGLYGDDVRGQVRSRLVEQSLSEVFKEKGLSIVSHPEIESDPLQEGQAFRFSAVVEVKPELEIDHYTGLAAEKIKLSVDEEQVEQTLKRLQESHAQLEPVEDRDVVQLGDCVVVDFTGFVDGKPLSAGRAQNYPIEVGSGEALPQFEQALLGLKKNGEQTINIAYPEDHADHELAGKIVEFSIAVREIRKKILPPLDDEFAKDHGECATLEELRGKIRSRLATELDELQTRDLKEQLLTRLIEAHPFEVPAVMVDRQLRYLMERQQTRLRAAGGEQAPSTEHLRKELEAQAERQVRATLLVEAIAEREKIAVSNEEVQARVESLTRAAGDKGSAIRRVYSREDTRENLRSQMIFDCTVDFLLQHAKVREKDVSKVDAQGKKS
jgi:trigger factor